MMSRGFGNISTGAQYRVIPGKCVLHLKLRNSIRRIPSEIWGSAEVGMWGIGMMLPITSQKLSPPYKISVPSESNWPESKATSSRPDRRRHCCSEFYLNSSKFVRIPKGKMDWIVTSLSGAKLRLTIDDSSLFPDRNWPIILCHSTPS